MIFLRVRRSPSYELYCIAGGSCKWSLSPSHEFSIKCLLVHFAREAKLSLGPPKVECLQLRFRFGARGFSGTGQ